MLDKHISGQLIALTKEIKLTKPNNDECFISQFIAGNQIPFAFSGGIDITWWYTQKAVDLAKAIASMSINKYESLKHGDVDEIAKSIKNTFTKICLDEDLFVGNDIFLRRKENLFEARAISDIPSFSEALWRKIYFNLKSTISDWCFIYPIPRIFSESFELEHDDLSIFKINDIAVWDQLAEEYPSVTEFKNFNGIFKDHQVSTFRKFDHGVYLVCKCKCKGTSSGAKLNASLIFKRFLSVLFSVFHKEERYSLLKSGGQKYKVSAQFSHKESNSETGYIVSEIGELLPNYIKDYTISTETISLLKKWYELYSNLNSENKNRLEKSAHFINHGMNSGDIESFINYFIALDALFGRRGEVERLILEGVMGCMLDEKWKHKAEWLFELRSELVHGGSRYVAEWEKYERYQKHFKSKPENDVEKLAFTCLLYNFRNEILASSY
ncbi:MAG: hypothetical protein ACXVDW_21570 [Bacteroidia bacterium]